MQEESSLYSNLIFAKNAIKDINRFRKIISVIVQHGFGHFVQDLKIQWLFQGQTGQTAVNGQDLTKSQSDLPKDMNQQIDPIDQINAQINAPINSQINSQISAYERIRDVLQELGPTFVKLGQILSTRQDILPKELCAHLQTLQNQVKPLPFEEIKKQIEISLQKNITDAFASFEVEPLASASIAQVHIAKLHQGEEVVVKIQRPSIKTLIESDLSILKYLAQQVEKNVPEFKAFAPVLIIQEFERGLIKELDFKIEARHLEKFAKNFVGWDQIHIPKVYRELSTENILVMEKIPGVKITMAKEKYPNLDMNQIAELSVEMLFKQVFEDGLFHGDLHPGNLLVSEDGKLGLIDFGLVGRLSPQMRDILADLLMQITMKNDEMVARIIYEMSANGADIDYHAWERDISELMDKHFSNSSLADVDFGGIVKDLIDGAIAHQVSIPSEYTMFFKAVMTVEGIGKIVSPELDLLATCQPFVEKLIKSRYEPDRLMQEGVELLYALTRSSKRLPKVMNRLVEKIEDRKFAIRIDDQDLKVKLQIKQKFGNRQIIVYIATVFLAFAVYLTEKPDLSANLILLDKILYLLAFAMLSHVLWKSFWEDY